MPAMVGLSLVLWVLEDLNLSCLIFALQLPVKDTCAKKKVTITGGSPLMWSLFTQFFITVHMCKMGNSY